MMHSLLVTTVRNHPALENLSGLIAAVRGFDRPVVCSLDHSVAMCQASQPALVVVLIDPVTAEQVLENVKRLRASGSWHILAVGPLTDAKLILRCMQAGVEVFLDQEDLKRELNSALYRIHMRKTNPDQPGQLLAVLSASGGCGSSTIAVNLAMMIAKHRHVCHLIDLNLGKSDLAPLLDLKPQYSLSDVCRYEDRLDASLYEKLLVRHASGIVLLPAPSDPEEINGLTIASIERALDLATASFTEVVVDLEDSHHDEQIYVLKKATRILLVCRLDFTSIRQSRRILEQLAKLGIARESVEVVVNQYSDANQLPVPDAEAAMQTKIRHFIPRDDDTMGLANNLGVPAALTHPDAKVVQSIAKLVGLEKAQDGASPLRSTLVRHWRAGIGSIQKLVEKVRPRRSAAIPPLTASLEVTPRHEPALNPNPRVSDGRAISA